MKAEVNQRIIVEQQNRINGAKNLSPPPKKVDNYWTYSTEQKYDTNLKPKINPF